MIEVLKSDDRVRLHFLKSVLEAAGLHAFLFEGGSPWPGVFPARLMVPEDEVELARRLVAEAEAG